MSTDNVIGIVDTIDQQHSQELAQLARNISCNFVDARNTSKAHVGKIASINNEQYKEERARNRYLISTCLRYEIYDCLGSQKVTEPFFYVRGITCFRRLLSLLVGLQSEIVGEREIHLQVVESIRRSADAGILDAHVLRGLEQLVLISTQIRERSGVGTDENYSTIAADLLLEHLRGTSPATVGIVGGGYMADKFFRALLHAKAASIKKILWFNRSTAKVDAAIKNLIDLLDFDIEVLDLESGKHALQETDAIFCALSHSGQLYADIQLANKAFVIDVSYPQVFADKPGINLLTVSNTHFDRLVKKPATAKSVAAANKEIDSVVDSFGRLP